MCNMRAVPVLEPGMGNIIPLSAFQHVCEKHSISERRDTQCVHGVCYLVTKHEFDDIYQSEGGQVGSYIIQTLKFISYEGEEFDVQAWCVNCYWFLNNQLLSLEFSLGHAFVHGSLSYCPYNSGRCDITLDLPSKRYITLLREGAKHWELHPKYCEYLNNYPHADYPKWIKYPFVGGILIPVLGPFFAMIFVCKTVDKLTGGAAFKKSFPYLMLYYFRPAMRILWGLLDFKPLYLVPFFCVILFYGWNFFE